MSCRWELTNTDCVTPTCQAPGNQGCSLELRTHRHLAGAIDIRQWQGHLEAKCSSLRPERGSGAPAPGVSPRWRQTLTFSWQERQQSKHGSDLARIRLEVATGQQPQIFKGLARWRGLQLPHAPEEPVCQTSDPPSRDSHTVLLLIVRGVLNNSLRKSNMPARRLHVSCVESNSRDLVSTVQPVCLFLCPTHTHGNQGWDYCST